MSSATAPFDQDEEDGGDRLAVAALAEQALLGAIMLEPSEIGHIRDWLEPGHFYRPAHQALYRALLDQDGNEHPGRPSGWRGLSTPGAARRPPPAASLPPTRTRCRRPASRAGTQSCTGGWYWRRRSTAP